jgi:hypothetical protein
MLLVAASVRAHAGITPALGVNGDFARKNVQIALPFKPCGRINPAENIDTSTPIPANADGTFDATITNFNG